MPSGHVRKHGPSWQIVLNTRDAEGRRRPTYEGGFKTKRAAEAELTRLLAAQQSGSYVEPSRLTVGAYLEQWLREYAKPYTQAKTYERYEEIVRLHLTPALGHLLLQKLSPLDIQAYYTKALKAGRLDGKGGLSAQTVLHHHRCLSTALKQAVKWQLLPLNPAEAVIAPTPVKGEVEPVDVDGSVALMAAAEGSWVYIPLLLATGSGMRRGEVLALRWADVDFGTRVATARQSLSETRAGLEFKTTKTNRTRRFVLPTLVTEELQAWRREQREIRMAMQGAWEEHDLICCRNDGAPWRPGSLTHAFIRLAKAAGYPLSFQDLRHSHASQLLAAGVDLKVVSSRLGHSSIRITADTYTHLLPGVDEDAAARMDAALRQARERRNGSGGFATG